LAATGFGYALLFLATAAGDTLFFYIAFGLAYYLALRFLLTLTSSSSEDESSSEDYDAAGLFTTTGFSSSFFA
jgi:hypothetical protein